MPHRRVPRFCVLSVLAASAAVHAGDYQRSYLVDSLLLPTTNSQATSYAIDLDGDGSVENNFGQVMSAFAAQGIDMTGTVATAIANGSVVHIVDQRSADVSFTADAAAVADWSVGKPLASPPAFDGTDTPSSDGNFAPGVFVAPLSGGAFTSADPATTTTPVDLTLQLQFGPATVPVTVQSARLSFTTDNVGPGHMQGQLNGAIPHDDWANKILPAWQIWFNQIVQTNTPPSQAANLKGLFDTGCNGHPEFANDNAIELCELTENSLMNSLLAPDVQTRDSGGTYGLSNSLGIGFTAVRRDRIFADGFGP